MADRDNDAIVAAVGEQYDAFPYPPFETISQEDTDRDLRASFNVDLRLGYDRSLKSGAKVWVPGCGTRWAAMLALQFRDVEIVATDLSETTLTRQAQLARTLGLNNIEFRRENLLEARYDQEFDFISCVGVLHHLPDPDEGFRVLGRALTRAGLAEIMVYDRLNRFYSMRMREILETFDPESKLDAEARFALAIKVLKGLNQHASFPRELRRVLAHLDTEPHFRRQFADFVSHPQEHYFDVPVLLRTLRSAGLRPHTWRPAYRFDPKFMLDDSELTAEIDQMDSHRSIHLAHLLGAGNLEVFVERTDAPASGDLPSVPTRLVRSIADGLLHRINGTGKMPATERESKAVRDKRGLWFDGGERRPAVAAYGVELDCLTPGHRRLLKISDLGFKTNLRAKHVEAILRLAEEPTTIGQIAAAVSDDTSLPPASCSEIESMCDQLCRTPFRVLATI